MKVLEFAFDAREPSNYLPHTYTENCVCYVGTHDNAPIMAWKEETGADELAMAKKYLGLTEEEGLNWGIIRGGMTSVADLFIVQIQDYLGLGNESRMNTPGVASGNWQWRLKKNQLTKKLAARIADLTWMSGRDTNPVCKKAEEVEAEEAEA
jgi:4-alpha-glucanotransferase